MELKFKITNQLLKRKDKEEIVQKCRNLIIASFTFSDEWNDQDKFVIFKDSHDRTTTMRLGKTLVETCVVPSGVLKGRYFTVSVYAGDLITTNAVTIYLLNSTYENQRSCHNPRHRHYEKDIFVEIFESLESKVDDIVFSDDSLQFWGNDELIQSISLPYANETSINSWMAETNAQLETINDSIEEIEGQLGLKSDIGHSHSKDDIVDFDDEIDENIDGLLGTLTEALLLND